MCVDIYDESLVDEGTSMNKKLAAKNVIASLVYEIIAIIYGFLVPRIILKTFGSEVNGLVSSLGQFLNYITLLEGGLTGVIMAALYKPLASKNDTKISAIIVATEKFFRKIAVIFVFYSIAVSVIYPLLVKTSFSFAYVGALSLIISISLFVQYFFSLTLRILIRADQKGYIVSITQIVFTIVNLICTIVVVNFFPQIHILKLCSAAANLIQPYIFNHYVKKHYRLDMSVEADKTALKQRWDGFGQNLAFFIHSNTDIAVLTVFSSLTNVSVYAVYFMVVNALKTLVVSISSAIVPSIGNTLAISDQNAKEKAFDFYEFVIYFITTFAFTCGGLLISPFVKLYTSGITDANYNQPLFALILVFAEALYCFRDPFVSVAYAAGHFRETAKFAYFEAVLNIIISVVLVSQYGLIGVAVGTSVSMFYRMICHVIYLKENILYRSMGKWLKCIGCFSCASFITIFVSLLLPLERVTNYAIWFIMAIVVAIITVLIETVFSMIFYRKMTKSLIATVNRKLLKRG